MFGNSIHYKQDLEQPRDNIHQHSGGRLLQREVHATGLAKFTEILRLTQDRIKTGLSYWEAP